MKKQISLPLLVIFLLAVLCGVAVASQGFVVLPNTTPPGLTGTQLANDVNAIGSSFITMNAGTSAPAYIGTGGMWVNTSIGTSNVLNIFDGANSVALGNLNTSTHAWSPIGSTLTIGSSGQLTIDVNGSVVTSGHYSVINSTGNALITANGHEQSGGGAMYFVKDDVLGNVGYIGQNSVINGGTVYGQLDFQNPQSGGTVCLSSNGTASASAGLVGCDLYLNSSDNVAVKNSLGVGTATPLTALHVVGTATATSFSGSGASLTGIGTASLGGITGTPSSTTYLSGNGTWGTPAGTGVSSITIGTGLASSAGSSITTTGSIYIATSGISAASYGSASAVPVCTFNAQGQATTCSNTNIAIGTSALSGVVAVANGGTGASSAGITSFNNITGYTASGATGTTSTNLMFSASPTTTGTMTGANSNWSGNVGIGTTTPASPLDVWGTIDYKGQNAFYADNPNANISVGSSQFSATVVPITNTSGIINTGMGIGAMNKVTSGYANTALGAYTMFNNTTGKENVALGNFALWTNTTGQGNVSIGEDSMDGNTSFVSGGGTTAALNYNNVIGWGALQSALTGSDFNEGLGHDVLQNGTLLTENIAIGEVVMQNMTVGTANVGIGFEAMNNYGSGTDNVAVGDQALFGSSSSNGNYNTAVGAGSLASIGTGGASNTGIGRQAGLDITTGTNNTIIGAAVGSTVLTTGSNNILIGVSNAITTAASGTNNTINIGGTGGSWALVTGTGTNTTEQTQFFGTVGIGTATLPNSSTFVTVGTASFQGNVYMSGLVTSGSSQTKALCSNASSQIISDTVTCISSLRNTKNHIRFLDEASGLAEVMKLQPISFVYKNTKLFGSHTHVGLIAEDVEAVDPRLADYSLNGELHGVEYENLTAVLVKAIQQQQKEIEAINGTFPFHKCVFGLLVCAN